MRLFQILLMSAGLIRAVPLIYTFSGNMGGEGTGVIDDRYPLNGRSGLYWSNGVRYNSDFNYQILIDFDLPGKMIMPDGSEILSGEFGNPAYSFFYAEYFSGDLFQDLFHGSYYRPGDSLASYTRPRDPSMKYFGLDFVGESRSYLYVKPNVWNDITIHSWSKYAEDWEVGDEFTLSQTVQNPLFVEEGAYLWKDVVLTEISPVSIPEPKNMVLFLLGTWFIVIVTLKKTLKAFFAAAVGCSKGE